MNPIDIGERVLVLVPEHVPLSLLFSVASATPSTPRSFFLIMMVNSDPGPPHSMDFFRARDNTFFRSDPGKNRKVVAERGKTGTTVLAHL